MIRIYDGGNQLTLTRELGANTNYEYYLYSCIKSVSWIKDVIGNYFLVINFITDDSDNPLKIKLLDTGSIALPAQYANTEIGAKLAVQDLHNWINNSFTLLGGLATEATLTSIASDTSQHIITPFMIRVVDSSLTFPGATVKSISFSNVGTANAIVKSVILKPGETINFDAGALGNIYLSGSFPYNCTTNPGAELLIIYNV